MIYTDIISDVEINHLARSVKYSKLAMAADPRNIDDAVTPGVIARGHAPAGSGHDCFLKGIEVAFCLTLTIKAWTEAERYNFLPIVTSQSTMHKLQAMDADAACIEYVDDRAKAVLNELICRYNETHDPVDRLRMLYSCPVGLRLTADMRTNYLQLKTIYHQRKAHALPEWRAFCEWIETLPMFRELILAGEEAEA